MANKEAILVLLDMGSEMLERFNARGGDPKQRRIDVAVNCIKLMLQQKLFNSKTHEIGLILFGLKEKGDEKIMYIRGLGKPDTDFLKNVLELKNFESDEVKGGDIFEALDQTIETIDEFVGTKKYEKKVFLMTTGAGKTSFNEQQVQNLMQSARRVNVKINVIGFDFLMQYNPHSENKAAELQKLQQNDKSQTPTQNMNQKLLMVLKQSLNDSLQFFPSHIAMEIYEQFRSRQVNGRSKFNGELQISDNLKISIQMYTKTTEEKLPGLKTYSLAVDFNPAENTATVVRDVNMCIQEDPNMQPVDKSNIIKAYHYGKQLIPISDVLSKQMQYETVRELKVLGFVDSKHIPRQSFMGGVDVLIASQSNALAKKGIAALANAMKSLQKYAVIRYVWRANSTPKLCALLPQVGKDHECLYMVQIPTSESVRDFQFNSLKESSKNQQDLMGKLIDKMDLMSAEEDETEALQMKYTFNPTRQYFYQTVFHRVFNPPQQNTDRASGGAAAAGANGEDKNTIPELDPNITAYINPETNVYRKAAAELAAVKDAFKLEEQDLKNEVAKKIYWQQLFNPNYTAPDSTAASSVQIKMENSEMTSEEQVNEIVIVGAQEDLEQIAVSKKFAFDDDKKDDVVRRISTVSPVDDFFQMLTNRKEDLVSESISQMQGVIEQFIEISIRGSFFEKAIDCLKAMRRGCTSEFEEMEAPLFNKFLFAIKDKCLKSDQKGFWKLVIEKGITLITSNESKKSPISTREAVQFLDMEEEVIQKIPDVRKKNDDFDIMDELE